MNSKRVLIFLLGCLLISSFSSAQKAVQVEKGILDLRDWQVEAQPSFFLNGEWNFYWQELLSEKEIKQKATSIYIPVPGSWSSILTNEQSYPSKGYATYHLEVILPPNFREELALKMPSLGTACRLLVNDELLFEVGKVSKSPEGATPEYYTKDIHFTPKGDSLHIIIQVSNYHHRKGGLWEGIRFGLSSDIQQVREQNIIVDCIIFGVMIMMAVYHLGLYILTSQEKSALYFSIGCLSGAIRTVFVDNYIINEVIQLPWNWVFKIEYLTFFSPILLFPLFFQVLYPNKFSKKLLLFLKWTIIPLSIFCILAPPFYTTYLTMPAQILFLVMILYTLKFLITLRKTKSETIAFTIGTLAIFLASVNDILYIEDIIDSVMLGSFGFLIFLFAQAYLITERFTNSYQQNERLTTELNIVKNRLEEKVIERTARLIDANQILSEQKDKIIYQNDELKQKNQLLEELNLKLEQLNDEKDALIDIVAHDLKAPLNRVKGLGELIRLTESLDEEGKLYLNKVDDVCNQGEELIADLLSISSLDKELDEELVLSQMNLASFLKDIHQEYQTIAENKNITLHLELINDENPFILSEINYLTRILDNLLSNAIKFSYPKSNIWLKTKFLPDNEVLICIEDEGQGMSEEDKNKLFKKFQKLSARPTAGESSSGLGLSIVKSLVEKLNGTIQVKSQLGKGTEFIILFPVNTADPLLTTKKESS